MAEAKRDGNRVPTLIGVSSADGITPVVAYVDPTTHRVLVQASGASTPGGADTQVQFNDGGTLSGEAGMTYNKTTDTLTLAGHLNAETVRIEDTDASHYLVFTAGSNLTANRALTFTTGDAARTLTLAGDLNIAANFTTSGANALTLTTTGATNVTLPTTGTLATLAGTETLSGKTLTQPKIASGGYIADANGNELVIFTTTASAVNEVTFANAATGSNPSFTASGGDANVGLDFQAKGTGVYRFLGTADQAAEIRLFEDTDNGTNYTAIKVGAQAGNLTLVLPTTAGSSGNFLKTDGSGNLSWDSPTAAPGGSDTQVQFNDGGSLGGDAGMTYNKTTDVLTLAGAINMETANIEDSDASHYLVIKTTSNLTANRDFTIVPGDAARTLTMAGNINVAADLITSGANSLTLTTTGATNVTLPTTGTLATLAGTETLSGKTLTAPKFADLGYIADANGNELLILDTVGSAVNEVTFANAATGGNPTFTASGGDANVGFDFVMKGTGTFNLKGNATQAAELRLYEDTDNGTNYTAFKVGSQAGDVTYTLPTADGSSGQVLSTNGSGALSWATAGGVGSTTYYHGTAWETAARNSSATTGSGSITYNSSGVALQTGTTNPSYALVIHPIMNGALKWNAIAYKAGYVLQLSTLAATNNCEFFIGIGSYSLAGNTFVRTVNHAGFYGKREAGTWNLYASQGDGTTGELSSVLTTLASSDVLELFHVGNGGTQTDFYWNKNNGTVSSVTTLTTNDPLTSNTNDNILVFVGNNSTAGDNTIRCGGAFFNRG